MQGRKDPRDLRGRQDQPERPVLKVHKDCKD